MWSTPEWSALSVSFLLWFSLLWPVLPAVLALGHVVRHLERLGGQHNLCQLLLCTPRGAAAALGHAPQAVEVWCRRWAAAGLAARVGGGQHPRPRDPGPDRVHDGQQGGIRFVPQVYHSSELASRGSEDVQDARVARRWGC